MADTRQQSVRLPIPLHDAITEISADQHVSFNRALTVCLELGAQRLQRVYGGSLLAFLNQPQADDRPTVEVVP